MTTQSSRPTYDPWWKAAVVYQVYPRSFADSDGDGVGDLRGVIEHLDHIAGLGCDVVWLSPVYRSPQDDNGYDISDYQDIDPTFGTLADLDELVDQLHRRGMRLVMDLVVNHTSDEHPWFVESRADRTNPKADWYVWRDPRPGTVGGTPGAEPNNWGSVFSGRAWEWVPERGQYYLHLFSRKQPDLDWENPDVRAAVHSMMRWWLDRGVDGFRMDVINVISKPAGLPDGPVDATGLGAGLSSCVHGPRLEEFLAEMKREVFDPRPGTYLLVGEAPGATPEQGLRLTDRETGSVSMVFQFEHVDLDHEGSKWRPRPMPLTVLKHSLGRWQEQLGERGWNSLYFSNHDQPRPVSRWGNDRVEGDRAWWRESATALATVLHLQRGTPFVYQGEELGMTNAPFASVEELRDIESLNHYRVAVDEVGQDPEEVLDAIRRIGRDNARTPVQWTSGPHAGFTTGTPWIDVNPNHRWLNAEAQVGDPTSVYSYYRALVELRHGNPVVVDGSFTMLEPDHPRLYAYRRTLGDRWVEVLVNWSDEPLTLPSTVVRPDGELLLANLPERAADPAHAGELAPWEARVLGSR
ncbi:alpha-glucosidase [Nocardioides caldifontis]|uniref:alpha-glucosidase n=1 Tax=Nocardioides caldifontis TaxID=2588938 RepID=UPI0011E0245D|nr:alpha-glucosidase [Nocardioides caldifontis]